jgi:hypothetical protein
MRLRLAKKRVLILGLLVLAALLVAFVWHRARSHDLVVQLVDKETGKPLRNLKVTIEEFDNVPVLYHYEFLPEFMRRRSSSQTIKSGDDGSFRTRRIVWRVGSGGRTPLAYFTIEVGRGRKVYLINAAGWLFVRGVEIGSVAASFPVPKGETLVIPVDPAWMQ